MSQSTMYAPDSPAQAGDDRLAHDILKGAQQIAFFLFGQDADRRQVYNLAETGAIPTFRLGRIICARRSTLRSWIGRQEAAGQGFGEGDL